MGLFTLRCADSRHSRAKSASRITFGDNEIATDIRETTQICVIKRAPVLHKSPLFFLNVLSIAPLNSNTAGESTAANGRQHF